MIWFRKLEKDEILLGYNPKSKQHNVKFAPPKGKELYAIVQDQFIIGVAFRDKVGYTVSQLNEEKGWITTNHKKIKNLDEVKTLFRKE